MGDWTVLSNHGIALVCVARDPGMRLRDIADCIGVSDRTAFGVVNDLVEAGYLRRHKEWRNNRYEVVPDMPMRHPAMEDHWVGEILAVLVPESLRSAERTSANASVARDLPRVEGTADEVTLQRGGRSVTRG